MQFIKLFRRALMVYLCLLAFFCQAQKESKPYSDVTIASPTAASLGKYADIPVNHFTGVPQISIPIYTIKEGPLSLPISLSYHASGLKVWEPASWVGLGWTLNAGGVITRTVVGGPDENGTNNAGTETHGHFSNYGYSSYLFIPSPNPDPQEDWEGFATGRKDGEPDLFFFNFNGYTGKFYFNDDRTPILVPESDLRITANYSGGGKSISDFIITTPDGIKYYFGTKAKETDKYPVEITNSATPAFGPSTANVISSWYLSKIESADGKFLIKLSYEEEKYGYFTIATSPVDPSAAGGAYGAGNFKGGYGLVKNVIQGIRLNKITFSNGGSVNFIATTSRQDLSNTSLSALTSSSSPEITNDDPSVTDGAKSLDVINIMDDNGNCKQYTFTYSYFIDGSTSLKGDFLTNGYSLSSDKKRLKLDKITESACNSAINLPPYIFTYNTTPTPPRRICFGVDHWGFYNGQVSNAGLIPDYFVDDVLNDGETNPSRAKRDADETAMQCGILKKITYPTRGITTFDYEANNVFGTFEKYSSVTLCGNMPVHRSENGQTSSTELSNYSNFTVQANSDLPLEIKNYSNFPVYFTISQGSNAPTYKVKIQEYIPSNDNPTNDANLRFYKYTENIPTTSSPILHPFGYAPPGASTGTLYFDQTEVGTSLQEGATVNLTQTQMNTVSEDRIVGGVRIKTVSTSDGVTSKNMVTNYSYATANKSNGILFSRSTYVQSIRNDIVKDVGYYSYDDHMFHPWLNPNGCISANQGAGVYYKSAGTLRPMATVQGYHMGYSEVTVSQTGKGHTVYQYETPAGYTQNYPDLYYNRIKTAICNVEIPNYPPAPLPFDYTKGDLKSEAYYSDTKGLLKETTYKNYYSKGTISTPGFIAVSLDQGGGSVQYLGTKYVLTSAQKTQTHIVEKEYPDGFNNGSITNITDVYYASTNHHQPTSKTILQANGDLLETKIKSAFEFVPTSVSNINDGYAQYLSDSTTCRTQYSNHLDYLVFSTCITTARTNYVTYRRNNFIDAGNQYQVKHAAAVSSAGPNLKAVLLLQDDFNNAPVEVTQWRNSKLLDATYTTYTGSVNGNTLKNEVYPNNIYKISLITPSNTFTAAAINNNTINNDNRYPDNAANNNDKPETVLKFDNGNLVEITPKNGLTTAYIWGYSNTLPIVKATGVNYTTVKSSYDAAGGNLTQLRSQATQYQQLSTYTYTPLLGMTSETDPSGKTVSYMYDALWRLHLVKDLNDKILEKIDYHYAGEPEPISATCACTDLIKGKKCINGQCQQAVRINIATIKNNITQKWKCSYIWQWSDGSTYPSDYAINGTTLSETGNDTPCFVDVQ